MMRISIPTLAALALVAACSKNTPASNDPEAAKYDDYYSETSDGDASDPATGDGAKKQPGERPKVRAATGTKAGAAKTGKNKALVAKKPPVKGKKKGGGKKKGDAKPADPVQLAGVAPSIVVAGGVFELYGDSFADDAARNAVFVGKKRQKVLAVEDGMLVVEAVGPAKGTVAAAKGKDIKKRPKGKGAETKAKVAVMAAGEGFAKPHTAAGQGLLGTVYAIGQASTEVPDFNTLTPIGTIIVDNLDASGTFAGFPNGEETLSANFGIHFQGSLNIVEAGEYELCLTAGDGAVMFLDGTPIVDADGTGDAREVCEVVVVEPGEYELQLLYYQNDADLTLRLTWAKDGGEKAVIPAEAFFPPESLAELAAAGEA